MSTEQNYFDSDYPNPNTRVLVEMPSNVQTINIKKVMTLISSGQTKYQLVIIDNQGQKSIATFSSLTDICEMGNNCGMIDKGRLSFVRYDWPVLEDLLQLKYNIEAKNKMVRSIGMKGMQNGL